VIESGMLTRQIEKAQRKVEAHNFDIRKNLLLFDDVANDQRKVVYQQRTEVMGTEDLSGAIRGLMEDSVGSLLDLHMPKHAASSDLGPAGSGGGRTCETSTCTWIRRAGCLQSRSWRSRCCANAW